ncbi:hypothetical protein N0V90_000179 [Kalmusia sp. IMI 367209]|nr:hypothetical protein N0V90_000179 [Kalmusia sp. IMI 367209]
MNGARDETPELKKEIVSDDDRAQNAPDSIASFHALFDVYEEVLGARGIEPEDDGVMRQMLSKLAREEREDEGLMQRFRRVCGELDIDVEVNEDGSGVEITTELEDASTRVQPVLRPLPKRHASLDSFLDGSADKIAGTTQELPLRSRSSSGATSHVDAEAGAYAQAQMPYRPRSHAAMYERRRTAPNSYGSQNGRGASIVDRKSPRIREGGIKGTSQFGDYDADDSEHTDGTTDLDLGNVQIPGLNAPYPEIHQRPSQQYEPEPFRPSDTRLMDDAETFEQQRLHSLVRHYMQRWLERTREQIQRREVDMTRIAIAMDRRILMKGVLTTLHQEAENRRSVRETDRFFGRLEGRAERARNLFLLTKAFTHWARSAEDEVQRTSVARRHILRTRLFNGWREITAVNELKIQHFVLGKFLDKWRRRTAEVRGKQELAIQIYDDILLRKYYKSWFFRFCEVAAPAWHNVHLKRVIFQKWQEIVMILRERETWATSRKDRQIQRNTIAVWQQKATVLRTLGQQADSFRRRGFLTSALATFQRQAQFVPLLAQFEMIAKTRRLRSILQTWRQDARLSREAKNVDHMRVLRNAWTAWNDRLRIQALRERIDDRVLVETMYRWALASRVSLFQRIHDRNLKDSALSTWVTNVNERRNTLDSAERRFLQFKRTQLLRSYLRKIESATTEKRAEIAAVTVQYELKLKQRIFDTLLEKHDHLQQLKTWARDAQFYVLATHALKKWGEATQHARRIRRREVYTQVRRTVKINLVRKTFGIWREKANDTAEHHRQAEEVARIRTMQNADILLTHWRDRTRALLLKNTQAAEHRNDTLKTRCFHSWEDRLARLQASEAQAIGFYEIGSNVAAAKALDRMAWIRRLMEKRKGDARELYEFHFEKHCRAMLKFWIKRTRDRLAARPASPSPTARSKGRNDHDDADDEDAEGHDDSQDRPGDSALLSDNDSAGDDTHRLEAWTAFDENALGLSNLDLSLSLSPQHKQAQLPPNRLPQPYQLPPSLSRPQTYPLHALLSAPTTHPRRSRLRRHQCFSDQHADAE